MTSPFRLYARRKARRLAVQGCYHWLHTQADWTQIIADIKALFPEIEVDWVYLETLIKGVVQNVAALDAWLEPYASAQGLQETDPIGLSILRLAIFELEHSIDLPTAVIINESVLQAKRYGATDGYKFINACLQQLSRQIRSPS